MYMCQICARYASPNFDSTLCHIGAVHSHNAAFNVHCGIKSCPRTFCNYHSFHRHIREKHAFMLESTSVYLHQNEAPIILSPELELTEEEPTEEVRGVSANGGGDSTAQKEDIKKSEAIHVLKLKEQYKLAQTTVDSILCDTEEITARVVARLRNRVPTDLLSKRPNASSLKIAGVFEEPTLTPFRELKTEFLQEKYFWESLGLVVSDCVLMINIARVQ